MASLVVLKFETADGAQQGLTLSEKLQKQQLTEILDAATVTWPQGKSRPKTRHLSNLTKVGALDGAFWGMLFGILFFVPVLGMAVGAALGAMSGHFAHYGISNEFIDQVRQKITEGKSALFLLVGETTTDRVAAAFKALPPFEIISTNLTREQERKLKDEFEAAA
jgi:uncharacterized membrane protein